MRYVREKMRIVGLYEERHQDDNLRLKSCHYSQEAYDYSVFLILGSMKK